VLKEATGCASILNQFLLLLNKIQALKKVEMMVRRLKALLKSHMS